eukprot:m.125726 g.125726  ORF g.125726 m.125726 type:complete len:52 (+) comp17337_c0_seq16:1300-1455(+)
MALFTSAAQVTIAVLFDTCDLHLTCDVCFAMFERNRIVSQLQINTRTGIHQ